MTLLLLGLLAVEAPLSQMDAHGIFVRWLQAQNSGNRVEYEALYATRFTGIRRSGPRRVPFDRAGWMKDRARMFGKPMKVAVTDLKIRVARSSALVSFTQIFEQGNYNDIGAQQMVIVREAGAAKIASEKMLRSELNDQPVRLDPRGPRAEPQRDTWLGAALSCARRCRPADDAASAKPIPRDLSRLISSKRVVTIKGRLVPGVADCLLGSCCGSCSFEWTLAPRTDCPDWKLAIRRDREFFRRQTVDGECAGDVGAAGAEIIVKGRLQEAGDKILVTDMCRMGSDAVEPGSGANPTPPCPRLAPRPAPDPRRSAPPTPRSEPSLLNL